MKILRRIFNKDEKIGESILSKLNLKKESISEHNGTYTFEIDNFNISILRYQAFDMTTGSSWYNYDIKVDNILLRISKFTLIKIFNKIDYIYHQEEYDQFESIKEENRMTYKDIKINFNNARR